MDSLKSFISRLQESAEKSYWMPIGMLMILSPFLAEVLSGSTPVVQFFSPLIFLPYVVVIYGIPLMIVREVARRRKYGLLGLWCLGMIVGLYIESLSGGTLFHPLKSPSPEFATYGLVAGIRVPWTLFITLWHGLFSVVLPVFFVEYLLPKKANQQWLSLKATWTLGIVAVVVTVMPFFLRMEQSVTMRLLHVAFLIVVTWVLWYVAGRLPRSSYNSDNTTGNFSWKLFALGIVPFVLIEILPYLLVTLKISWLFFVLYFVGLSVVGIWTISRHRKMAREDILTLALGIEASMSLMALILGPLTGNTTLTITGAVFVFITVTLQRKRVTHSQSY